MRTQWGFVDATGKAGLNFGWDVITWIQNDPIVHTFMVFDDMVYETTETVYSKRSLSERVAGCTLHLFDVPGDGSGALTFCESMLGAPYDYAGIAGLAPMLLAERVVNAMLWPYKKLMGIKDEYRLTFVGNPMHIKQAYYCAEAVVAASRKIKPNPVPDWWFGASVTAPQLMRFAGDQGWTHRVDTDPSGEGK